MARRRAPARKKKTYRRKYPKAISIPNAVMGVVSANALTTALFDIGIMPFFTEGLSQGPASNNSYEVSLMELIKGRYGNNDYGTSLGDTIQYNLKRNWGNALWQVILTKLILGGAKNLGINRQLNKLVKGLNLRKTISFNG